MKTQMHRKAIAIATVVVLGLATTGDAALAPYWWLQWRSHG
jgi:hypothetical protein